MPKRHDLLERLSEDDPNYKVAKRFYLEAWADSHGLVADALSGRVSFSEFVERCANTFARGAELHIAFKDTTPIPTRCMELDRVAKKFIRKFSQKITAESERLGEAAVKEAVDEFSRRVNEVAARSKQRMFEAQLALDTASTKTGKSMDIAPQQKDLCTIPGSVTGGAGHDRTEASVPTPSAMSYRRVPDLKSSRERIDFVRGLAIELATIKQDLTGFCTAKSLKSRHPEFGIWSVISASEVEEIVGGVAFTPKAFAETLTLRKFGITSRETLRKDRKKLRKAQESRLGRNAQ